jgi:hypothetical protein
MDSWKTAVIESLKWLAATFGKDLLVATKDKLTHQWRRVFDKRPVLFLGQKQAGKSSLITFLLEGRPFKVGAGGVMCPPDPTLVAAIVDASASVQQKKWIHIKQDLPGDEQLRATWSQAVDDFHPLGIAYLVDAREGCDVAEQIKEACKIVLDTCYKTGPRELVAFHVFLNFSDLWATSAIASRSKQRIARDTLEDELTGRPMFAGLRTDVAVITLAPHLTEWQQATRALEKFSADMS